jgi:hypothetical protein
MAVVQGADRLEAILTKLIADAKRDGEPIVAVGYTAKYALAVHEDEEMKWKGFSRDPRIRRIEMGGDASKARPRPRKREPKGKFWDPQGRGQAKFLEGPARRDAHIMRNIVANAILKGMTLSQALLLAGLHLQGESQKLVPVDTGNLKSSAYTRLERGVPQ